MNELGLQFRLYHQNDYPAVKQNLIEADQFDPIWDSKDNYNGIVNQGGAIILGLIDGMLVGSVCIVSYGSEASQFFRLNVKKEWRNKGIGTKLLHQAELIAQVLHYKITSLMCTKDKVDYYKKRGYDVLEEYVFMQKKS